MLKIAVLLFLLAAIGGLIMAVLNYRKKNIPLILALGHGLLAAAGLVIFIVALISASTGSLLTISLILFIVAALGGFVLFYFQLRNQLLPSTMVLIHGLVAVSAFVLLLISVV